MFSSVLFKRIFLSAFAALSGFYLLSFWIFSPAVEQAVFQTQSWYIKKNLEDFHHFLSAWHRERHPAVSDIPSDKSEEQMVQDLRKAVSRTDHMPSGAFYIFDSRFRLLAPDNPFEEPAVFLKSEDIFTHASVQEAMEKAENLPVVFISYEEVVPEDGEETYMAWGKYLKDPGWYVMVSLKKTALLKRQDDADRIMLIILLVCFAGSLLIFWQSLRYFLRPIVILADMAEEYLGRHVISGLRYVADKGEAGVLGAVIYDAAEKLDELKTADSKKQIEHKQLFRSRERARERAWNMSRKNRHLEKKLQVVTEKNELLSKSEERYRAMLENIEEYFYEADLLGNLIFFNDALVRGLGYEKSELIGMNFRDFMDSDTADKAFWSFKRAYETGKPQKGSEWCLLRKDGAKFYIEISVSLIQDQHHEVIGFRGVARDVSNLIYLVNHDTLTGLNNRKAFFDRLEDTLKIARRDNRSKNIFYLDLNKFKKVNDDFGHDVGDEVLIEVARRLRATLRETDHICRLGGDEFTVILNNLNGGYQPEEVARRVCEALSEPYVIGKHIVSFISPSIGISTYPKDADTLEDLIRRADVAMFVAKARGGGYLFFNPSLEDEFEALKLKGPEPR